MKMRKFWAAWAVLFAGVLALPADTLPDPYCKFAGRDFSLAEVTAIVSSQDAAEIRSRLENKFPEIAAVVICSRANIKLSQKNTFRSLQEQFLLMSQTQLQEFDSLLSENGLTRLQWLERESTRFDNQLNEALQRWFKAVAGSNIVADEQIRSYYYRNMDKFRRVRLDRERLWIFAPGDNASLQKASAALQQGMLPETVRRRFSLDVQNNEFFDDLQKGLLTSRQRQGKYELVKGGKYWYLLGDGALERTYLPLDQDMSKAIAGALYDAYAKAYLSEVIKREFAGQKLHFY